MHVKSLAAHCGHVCRQIGAEVLRERLVTLAEQQTIFKDLRASNDRFKSRVRATHPGIWARKPVTKVLSLSTIGNDLGIGTLSPLNDFLDDHTVGCVLVNHMLTAN